MDESQEGIAYQREIDEALMTKMSPEEEDAVLEELAALEREQMVGVALGTYPSLLSPVYQIRILYISRTFRKDSRPRRNRLPQKVGRAMG